jgi:hypothetical protein
MEVHADWGDQRAALPCTERGIYPVRLWLSQALEHAEQQPSILEEEITAK